MSRNLSKSEKAVSSLVLHVISILLLKTPYFCDLIMVRSVLSYALTALILLSQVGLPLHMHYCKGVLESVSVFFSQGCNDHDEVVDLKACCKKEESKSCKKEGSDCCDDKVNILIQDNISLIPHFDKWDLSIPVTTTLSVLVPETEQKVSLTTIPGIQTDSGPPIYILHQALIFYA